MRMRSTKLVAVTALAAIVTLVGCEADKYEVFISARSMGDIGVIEVAALRPGGELIGRIGPSFIGRTMADINADDPIKIAVVLTHPEPIVVHIRGCSGTSCNDSDRIFVATRCYNVTGVMPADEVILYGPLSLTQDRDRDGFPADPLATCVDPPVDAPADCDFRCDSPALDCNGCVAGDSTCTRMNDDPMSSPEGNTIHPGAVDFCEDGIDQDCDGLDARCRDADGDGSTECRATDAPGTCDCNDSNRNIHPGATETDEDCRTGLDRNCDGLPPLCDDDDDGFPPCGLVVTGSCDCDDHDPTINPAALEVCEPIDQPPKDNDCDGLFDELPTCRPDDLDGDGINGCSAGVTAGCDCNDCDAGIHPGAMEICGNRVDEDCDGTTTPCGGNDTDHDGQSAAASGGTDCDDSNPMRYYGAPEVCGDGIDQSCTGDVACSADADSDGYAPGADCDDARGEVHPFATELCNGRDDDCDSTQDEVLSDATPITWPQGERGCTVALRDRRTASAYPAACMAGGCELDFHANVLHCGGCGIECNVDGVSAADTCVDGRCVCAAEPGAGACGGGETSWCCPSVGTAGSGGCKNRTIDLDNCGRCNNPCAGPSPVARPLGLSCEAGSCRCGASPALTVADIMDADNPRACCPAVNPSDPPSIVPVYTDPLNCGVCGNRCGPNTTCVLGRCECIGRNRDCNGSISSIDGSSDGCETNVDTSLAHCGACGATCTRANANPQCRGGTCSIAGGCLAGFQDCNGVDADGCETPLNTLTNCGSCGGPCSRAHATPTCASLSCAIGSCDTNYASCDGNDANGCETAINTLGDCGDCGVPCTQAHATATCATRSCAVMACDASWGDCGPGAGCETPLDTTANCGACGATCGPGETCNGGRCQCGTGPTGGVGAGEACRGGAPDCCNNACVVAATTVCRPSAGPCDVAEMCTGTAAMCPPDSFASAGTECRAAAGGCDVAEACGGGSAACPADVLRSAGTICRAAAGSCDVAESCSGAAAACPGDGFVGASTTCRASAGPCDVAENCTGSAAGCPGDGFMGSGTTCRPSAGPCDVAENCTGSAAGCPGDGFMGSGTTCRASAGTCDAAENCTGSSAACPSDLFRAAGSVCRAAAGTCDVAETCSGSSATCPSDTLAGAGTVCRTSVGTCDAAETCSGATTSCPGDTFAPASTVCRVSAGLCDVAENCTGSSATCPGDTFAPSTVECRADAGRCDVPENCTGAAATCPTDAFEPAGTSCSPPGGGMCNGMGVCI